MFDFAAPSFAGSNPSLTHVLLDVASDRFRRHRPLAMIRLRVLGALDLRDDHDQAIDSVLAQPKRVALLVYLAAARPYGLKRRDILVALLWPELDQARARNALSQSLHHL